MKKVTWKGIKKFLSENKVPMLQLGIMAGVAVVGDTSFAQDMNVGDGGNMSVIVNPLKNMQSLMTGPVPRAIGTIGVGLAGASWALNIENQVTKAGMRVIGGTGAAIGAGSFLGGSTGILFL